MLSSERTALIERLVYEVVEKATVAEGVSRLLSAEELQYFLKLYNWDDGFEAPTAVASHPSCDLGIALTLFWLANGLTWYCHDSHTRNNPDWDAFCEFVSNGILAGRWHVAQTSFEGGFGRVKLYQIKQAGIPAVFYTPVEGLVSS